MSKENTQLYICYQNTSGPGYVPVCSFSGSLFSQNFNYGNMSFDGGKSSKPENLNSSQVDNFQREPSKLNEYEREQALNLNKRNGGSSSFDNSKKAHLNEQGGANMNLDEFIGNINYTQFMTNEKSKDVSSDYLQQISKQYNPETSRNYTNENQNHPSNVGYEPSNLKHNDTSSSQYNQDNKTRSHLPDSHVRNYPIPYQDNQKMHEHNSSRNDGSHYNEQLHTKTIEKPSYEGGNTDYPTLPKTFKQDSSRFECQTIKGGSKTSALSHDFIEYWKLRKGDK